VAEGVRPPSAPKDLQVEGRKLWRQAVDEFELNPVELALLYQLCLTVDELAAMKADLAEMGTIVAGSRNQPRVNPLLGAIVSHRKLADQLAVALGLPLAGEAVGRRRSAAAKQAVNSRWAKSKTRNGRLASVHQFLDEGEKNG
jgi:P27 family predicted phage terminase small subunit